MSKKRDRESHRMPQRKTLVPASPRSLYISNVLRMMDRRSSRTLNQRFKSPLQIECSHPQRGDNLRLAFGTIFVKHGHVDHSPEVPVLQLGASTLRFSRLRPGSQQNLILVPIEVEFRLHRTRCRGKLARLLVHVAPRAHETVEQERILRIFLLLRLVEQ